MPLLTCKNHRCADHHLDTPHFYALKMMRVFCKRVGHQVPTQPHDWWSKPCHPPFWDQLHRRKEPVPRWFMTTTRRLGKMWKNHCQGWRSPMGLFSIIGGWVRGILGWEHAKDPQCIQLLKTATYSSKQWSTKSVCFVLHSFYNHFSVVVVMLRYCYHQVHFYKTPCVFFLPAFQMFEHMNMNSFHVSVFLGCQLGMLSPGTAALFPGTAAPCVRSIRSSSFGTHAFSELCVSSAVCYPGGVGSEWWPWF